jgi:hypothetical protein
MTDERKFIETSSDISTPRPRENGNMFHILPNNSETLFTPRPLVEHSVAYVINLSQTVLYTGLLA